MIYPHFRAVPPLLFLLSISTSQTATAATPEVIVTATRTPIEQSRLAAAVTVLDRAEIESLQVNTLPELLQGLAGVDVTESGGAGKLTSVFLRGAESDQVLVLVNGVRVGSVSAGITAFELLPVEHIERIEIVRGPRASQWGSEAIGGVIQIFTLTGREQPTWSLTAGGGRYETYRAAGNFRGSTGATSYALSAEYLETAGFDARQPIPGDFGFDQPDADGYDNASFHAQIEHRFADSAALRAFFLRASGMSEFDGLFQDRTDFVQQVMGLRASFKPHPSSRLTLQAGESRDETDNFAPDDSFASRFDSKRREVSLQGDTTLAGSHMLSAGLDYRDDRLDSDSEFTEASRDNVGVFAQLLSGVAGHELSLSLRYDDNEAFGDETTGGLGWSFDFSAAMRAYASYGTAFKTPSFNELFFPGFGNPDLGPETSKSFETGVVGTHSWGNWSARAYRTDIDDLIATVFDPDSGNFAPENVDRARIDGIEFETLARLGEWNLRATVSLLDPVDRNTGARLPRRAKQAYSADVRRAWGRLALGARVIHRGDRFDDVANTIKVDASTSVDLTADYRITRQLGLRCRIANLFDEDTATVATFNSAGRSAFVSLHYKSP